MAGAQNPYACQWCSNEGSRIENVDHHGNNRDDSLVHGGRGPRCPSPLRSAGDYKSIDFDVAPLRCRAKGRHCVHRANGALRHRQTGRPFFVSTSKKFIPCVDDECVLIAPLCLPRERERLVRNHAQLCHHCTGIDGDGRQIRRWLCRRFRFIRSTGNKQKARGLLHCCRFDDGKPMAPFRTIHLGRRPPRLGGHIQNIRRITVPRNCLDQFVLVAGIGSGNIPGRERSAETQPSYTPLKERSKNQVAHYSSSFPRVSLQAPPLFGNR